MLVQQILHAMNGQSLASGAGKEHILNAAGWLAQPSLQNGTSRLRQWRTALFATLSYDPQVSAVSRDNVPSLEPGDFG